MPMPMSMKVPCGHVSNDEIDLPHCELAEHIHPSPCARRQAFVLSLSVHHNLETIPQDGTQHARRY